MSYTSDTIEESLVRVDAPHYCAGLIVINNKVIDAAPILLWSLGKRWPDLLDYFHRKQYQVQMRDKNGVWATM
jgi:hypothetical protein